MEAVCSMIEHCCTLRLNLLDCGHSLFSFTFSNFLPYLLSIEQALDYIETVGCNLVNRSNLLAYVYIVWVLDKEKRVVSHTYFSDGNLHGEERYLIT